MTSPPPRRRITAPAGRGRGGRRGTDLPAAATASTSTGDDLYLRSLVRAQLRLAVVCATGFAASAALAAVLIATVPALGEVDVVGVPLAWMLQAYGFYPLVAVFAVVYVRAAGRNERRYRRLRGEA